MFRKLTLEVPPRYSKDETLKFSPLSMGCAAIGNHPRPLSDAVAISTVHRALDVGIRTFDTAPAYGYGLSEIRLGQALAEANIPREQLLISSKVGCLLVPDSEPKTYDNFPESLPYKIECDYSYDGVMQSFTSSLKRLQTDYLDIVHVHDLGTFFHKDQAPAMTEAFINGGLKALLELKEKGSIRAIGLAVNEWDIAIELMQKHNIPFDCIMLAQTYSLLEQKPQAKVFFQECVAREISVMIATPLATGILSGSLINNSFYYSPATPPVIKKASELKTICQWHDVSLQAAALQFPLLQSCVKTVTMGARSPAEIEQAVKCMNNPVPQTCWESLKKNKHIEYGTEEITLEAKITAKL
jgi:D-threo-aldose 1-dehydrogenase